MNDSRIFGSELTPPTGGENRHLLRRGRRTVLLPTEPVADFPRVDTITTEVLRAILKYLWLVTSAFYRSEGGQVIFNK
jgi:hypothetical protein